MPLVMKQAPRFSDVWLLDEPSWVRVDFDLELEPMDGRGLAGIDGFNPLDFPGGFGTVGTYVLPPRESAYGFITGTVDAGCWFTGLEQCVGSGLTRLTYTVDTIPEPLAGDVNVDGRVGFDDFLTLSRNFRRDFAHYVQGDIDGDFVVSMLDFLILSENYGATVEMSANGVQSGVAVPEPSARVPLVVAMLVFVATRTRAVRSNQRPSGNSNSPTVVMACGTSWMASSQTLQVA